MRPVTTIASEKHEGVDRVEHQIDAMHAMLIEINTKLDEKPSKSWVLYLVIITFALHAAIAFFT